MSTLAMSNVYIFSKAALKEVNLAQFGFYWFGIALILLFLAIFVRGNQKELKALQKSDFKVLATIGLLEIFSTSFFFMAINTIENPAIVSFLGNLKPLFVILLGFIVLNERFKGIEIFGLFITLIGAVILGYKPNLTFKMLYDGGIFYILTSIFFGAISMTYIRKNQLKIPSIIYATSRSFFLFVASIIFLIYTDSSLAVSQNALVNLSFGATLGPFLAVLASYVAIKNMEVSRVSLVGTSKGVFVLLGSYLVFGSLPDTYQIIGGLITIAGVITITLGKKLKRKAVKID